MEFCLILFSFQNKLFTDTVSISIRSGESLTMPLSTSKDILKKKRRTKKTPLSYFALIEMNPLVFFTSFITFRNETVICYSFEFDHVIHVSLICIAAPSIPFQL